jgi:hypothetical protein
MLFFWNKWNKWNKACKSLILKALYCSVAQNISRTILGFPLVDEVGKNNYALTQSITKTKETKCRGGTMSQVASASLTTSSFQKIKIKKSPACDWGLKGNAIGLNEFCNINKNATGFFRVPDFQTGKPFIH